MYIYTLARQSKLGEAGFGVCVAYIVRCVVVDVCFLYKSRCVRVGGQYWCVGMVLVRSIFTSQGRGVFRKIKHPTSISNWVTV